MADPTSLSVSITSLLGSLGAAGAAVAITFYFLTFIRDEAEKSNRLFQDFRDYHAESQKKFQDQLDRICDRQEQYVRGLDRMAVKWADANIETIKRAINVMTITRDIIHPEIKAALEKLEENALSDEEVEELLK